jgi:hypothetical protein
MNRRCHFMYRRIILCCRMPFRILPVSLCSKLRFWRAYTRWKAYKILQNIKGKSRAFDQFLSVGLLKNLVTHVAALRYFGHNSLLRTPFWVILYLLESLWNSIQDSKKILSIWAFFWASDEPMVASVHLVLAIFMRIPLCMFPKKAFDEPTQSSNGTTRSSGAYKLVYFFSGVHPVLAKTWPSDHPMPCFQHILFWL